MSLRIRASGEIVCAAFNVEAPGDRYLGDVAHRELLEAGLLLTEDDGDTWTLLASELAGPRGGK